ncbi:MAG: hypothetical protein D6732_03885, partial [Methanobacteriota archaeon]
MTDTLPFREDVTDYTIRIGGSGKDEVIKTFVDRQGNTYILGETNSEDFPSTNDPETYGKRDIFLLKLDSSSNIIWSTVFGGSNDDDAVDLFVDENNEIYITGHTISMDLVNACNEKIGGRDTFIAKFSASGNIQWSCYYGTNDMDISSGIGVVDGKVVVVGTKFDQYGKGGAGGGTIRLHSRADGAKGFLVMFSEDGNYIMNVTLDKGDSTVVEDLIVNTEVYIAVYSELHEGRIKEQKFLLSFTPNGELRWEKELESKDNSFVVPTSIKLATDEMGAIYFQNGMRMGAKFDRYGEKIHETQFNTSSIISLSDLEIRRSMLVALGPAIHSLPKIRDTGLLTKRGERGCASIVLASNGTAIHSSFLPMKCSTNIFAGPFDNKYWSYIYSSSFESNASQLYGTGGGTDIYWSFLLNPLDDLDGDGLPNYFEQKFSLDPFSPDSNLDPDGDGLTNIQEFHFGTNPKLEDTDGDQMPDDWEINNGLIPTSADARGDPDRDGLTNFQEYLLQTDPHDRDTDNDGIPDGWEVNNRLDPLTDDSEDDPDNDGLTNKEEFEYQTDPQSSDTDGDGMSDRWEVRKGLNPKYDDSDKDSDNDGLSNKVEYILKTNPKSKMDVVILNGFFFLLMVWENGR